MNSSELCRLVISLVINTLTPVENLQRDPSFSFSLSLIKINSIQGETKKGRKKVVSKAPPMPVRLVSVADFIPQFLLLSPSIVFQLHPEVPSKVEIWKKS